ncbi:MAG: helix-turn-helix transcriptional regulator [Bacillota bacterium]
MTRLPRPRQRRPPGPKAGLTQEELALKLGVTRQTINAISEPTPKPSYEQTNGPPPGAPSRRDGAFSSAGERAGGAE